MGAAAVQLMGSCAVKCQATADAGAELCITQCAAARDTEREERRRCMGARRRGLLLDGQHHPVHIDSIAVEAKAMSMCRNVMEQWGPDARLRAEYLPGASCSTDLVKVVADGARASPREVLVRDSSRRAELDNEVAEGLWYSELFLLAAQDQPFVPKFYGMQGWQQALEFVDGQELFEPKHCNDRWALSFGWLSGRPAPTYASANNTPASVEALRSAGTAMGRLHAYGPACWLGGVDDDFAEANWGDSLAQAIEACRREMHLFEVEVPEAFLWRAAARVPKSAFWRSPVTAHTDLAARNIIWLSKKRGLRIIDWDGALRRDGWPPHAGLSAVFPRRRCLPLQHLGV
mmetsp:Transcript_51050/g.141358  ORF Transcript_51050/g.141358 Transcript_51050/m.141358 type:complete len:346 (-) Transcript_51050:340-1377(-)